MLKKLWRRGGSGSKARDVRRRIKRVVKNPQNVVARKDSDHRGVVELSHQVDWVGRVGWPENQQVARAGAKPLDWSENFVDGVMHG